MLCERVEILRYTHIACLVAKWISNIMYTSINKKFKIISTFYLGFVGERVKRSVLVSTDSAGTWHFVAGNILLATKCWVHWMWMVLLWEVLFDLSGKGSTKYPSNFFPQQGRYRRRFIAYENSTHRYSQSGIQRSVLLNLLYTSPSFYACFVSYESIPGNKTRLFVWNICSYSSHILFDFLRRIWIFLYILSLVWIL